MAGVALDSEADSRWRLAVPLSLGMVAEAPEPDVETVGALGGFRGDPLFTKIADPGPIKLRTIFPHFSVLLKPPQLPYGVRK